MLKNSFALAAVFASAVTALTAAPAFADHNSQAPVAMSGTRQPDREVPVIEHRQPAPAREAQPAAAVAPVIVVGQKAGFATQPVVYHGLIGFGVPASSVDTSATRFGYARGGDAITKVGFATVR